MNEQRTSPEVGAASAPGAARLGHGTHGPAGGLVGRWRRFWPIARTEISLLFRRKSVWVFLILTGFHFLVASMTIYFASLPRFRQGFLKAILMRTEDPSRFFLNFMLIQEGVVVLLVAFAGAGLVARDVRTGALPFYLARPVDRIDYVLGKLIALTTIAAMATIVPPLFLFMEAAMLDPDSAYVVDHLRVLIAIIVYGGLQAMFTALIALGLSALFRDPRAVLIAWIGLFVMMPIAGRIARASFDDRRAYVISMWRHMRQVGDVAFGDEDRIRKHRFPMWLSALILAGVAGGSAAALATRVRATDVVADP